MVHDVLTRALDSGGGNALTEISVVDTRGIANKESIVRGRGHKCQVARVLHGVIHGVGGVRGCTTLRLRVDRRERPAARNRRRHQHNKPGIRDAQKPV